MIGIYQGGAYTAYRNFVGVIYKMKWLQLSAIIGSALMLSACGFHDETIKTQPIAMNDQMVPIVIDAPVMQSPMVESNFELFDHFSYFTHHGLQLYRFHSLQTVNQILKENMTHTLRVMDVPLSTDAPYQVTAKTTAFDISSSNELNKRPLLEGTLVVNYQLMNQNKILWSKDVTSEAQISYKSDDQEQKAMTDVVEFLMNNNTSVMAKNLVSSCTFEVNSIHCGAASI